MNDRTVVFGGGFLGKKIAEELGVPLIPNRIESMRDIEDACKARAVDTIINCIGKTGTPNVDWCESNKPETYFSNVHVPYLLAEYCKKNYVGPIKLIHISSGCVYQGDNDGRGWAESDAPNFVGSFYSFTKAAAERILTAYDNVLTLRIRMPIDTTPGGRELIGKLLKYNNIINTPNSVTVIDDFIGALKFLLKNNAVGVFNVCNPEPFTHKQILDIYEGLSGKNLEKNYIDAGALVTDAPRSNCVLNVDKLQGYLPYDEWKGMRKTEIALKDVITKYVKNGG